MTKVSDGIRRGLKEAIAYSEGKADARAYRVKVPDRIDVKAIRSRLDMTQEEFAGRFGFSVNTLRHWERGSRQPEGAYASLSGCYTACTEGRSEGPTNKLRARAEGLSLVAPHAPGTHA